MGQINYRALAPPTPQAVGEPPSFFCTLRIAAATSA